MQSFKAFGQEINVLSQKSIVFELLEAMTSENDDVINVSSCDPPVLVDK